MRLFLLPSGLAVSGPNALIFLFACGDALSSKWVGIIYWIRLGNYGLVGLILGLVVRISGPFWIVEWERGLRELGERGFDLTLFSVGGVGVARELGEREFELEVFLVGREIALKFERCEGGGPLWLQTNEAWKTKWIFEVAGSRSSYATMPI
ncbi:hypothetical protein VNO80_06582 [Phaseolus coccineus]|uniref:Uncharacterized protein n=1 Tax=Phaseolus coccineus TaxID=3886 RepID=A0AAN9NH36_PHACN